ncbi:MAG: hypothetical protein RIC19_16050 [Phaeodactylibacter sp.]|uniref:hypothetical protein n=1 Tax=Phaeodactylibacter sp. TaxID=1940289 RepID=UPI0032EF1027
MKNLFCIILFALLAAMPEQTVNAASTPAREKDNSAPLVSDRFYASTSSRLTRSAMGSEDLLPLSSFVAKPHHVSVLLSWVIARPAEHASFIIERALENAPWEKVGIVHAADGQREFSFWDVRVQPGAAYQYRLVNEAGEGGIQTSKPVLLEVDTPLDEYLIILSLIGFIGYLAYQGRKIVH